MFLVSIRQKTRGGVRVQTRMQPKSVSRSTFHECLFAPFGSGGTLALIRVHRSSLSIARLVQDVEIRQSPRGGCGEIIVT